MINLDAKRRFAMWAGFSSEPPGGSGEGRRKRRSGGNGLKKENEKKKATRRAKSSHKNLNAIKETSDVSRSRGYPLIC